MIQENSSQALQSVPLSYGQKRVGYAFNPSQDPRVTFTKEMFAQQIDMLYTLWGSSTDQDYRECVKEAMNQAETACMWAVKAITKPQHTTEWISKPPVCTSGSYTDSLRTKI